MRVLVLAPHPDDEVLGAGGTIARLSAEGKDVYVCIVTRGDARMFSEESVAEVRREAKEAHQVLGVRDTVFLEDFPAALLDTIPHSELNRAVSQVVREIAPDALFVPFNGDLHLDHRLVFESALVAARPRGEHRVQSIYAYETLSETNWNAPLLTPGFMPNVFVDITDHLPRKLEAMKKFESQIKPFPDERSLEAVEALAKLRGATVGVRAAEAFILIRRIFTGCNSLNLTSL